MKVLMTGTSGGIGKSAALKFLKEGHAVIGIDRLPSAISHGNYTHIVCDITKDLPDIDGVEILINNAGVQTGTARDIDVNLKGTVAVTEKYAFQDRIRSVVCIASASGSTGAEFPEYAASKGGVIAYAKNVALRLAKYGAVCNSISPGGVLTASNDHVLKDEKLKKTAIGESLLGKWATEEEIADWIYFVAVINRSMTAQDILIDNGEAAKSNFVW